METMSTLQILALEYFLPPIHIIHGFPHHQYEDHLASFLSTRNYLLSVASTTCSCCVDPVTEQA